MEFKRKGARSAKDIPHEILQHLNEGEIASVNLTEWLAVDQTLLLENVLIEYGRESYDTRIKCSRIFKEADRKYG